MVATSKVDTFRLNTYIQGTQCNPFHFWHSGITSTLD